MSGSSFQQAKLDRANLTGADLRLSIFEGASLDRVNMEEADIRGVDFSRTSSLSIVGRPCWDMRTRWPDGFVPPESRCTPNFNPIAGRSGADFSLRAELSMAESGGPYSSSLAVAPGDWFYVFISFDNLGDTILDSVSILSYASALPSAFMIDETSVTLYNSEMVKGRQYAPEALQLHLESQAINVNIGAYGARTNAFLRFRSKILSESLAESCGPQVLPISISGGPEGLQPEVEEVQVLFELPQCST